MKFKKFIKKYHIDIIVISSLLVVASLITLIISLTKKKDNLIASIYHRDEVVEVIDLSKEKEARTIKVYGDYTQVIVEVKKDAIRVKESGCPHKDCVNVGWVNSTNQPIICAYNAIYILLTSQIKVNDVEVV